MAVSLSTRGGFCTQAKRFSEVLFKTPAIIDSLGKLLERGANQAVGPLNAWDRVAGRAAVIGNRAVADLGIATRQGFGRVPRVSVALPHPPEGSQRPQHDHQSPHRPPARSLSPRVHAVGEHNLMSPDTTPSL